MHKSVKSGPASQRRQSLLTLGKEKKYTSTITTENSFFLKERLNQSTNKTPISLKKTKSHIQKSFHLENTSQILKTHSPNQSIPNMNSSFNKQQNKFISPFNSNKKTKENSFFYDKDKPLSFASVLAQKSKKKINFSKESNINVKKISLYNEQFSGEISPEIFASKSTRNQTEKAKIYLKNKENRTKRNKYYKSKIQLRNSNLKKLNKQTKKKKNFEEEILFYEENNLLLSENINSNLETIRKIRKETLLMRSLIDLTKLIPLKLNLDSNICNIPKILLKKIDFTIEKNNLLGKGGFAEVYKGKMISSLEEIAIKILIITPDYIFRLLDEITTMASFSHPNLVKLKGICFEEIENKQIKVYLVMELLKKDLKHLVFYDKISLTKSQKFILLTDVLKGLIILHKNNFVHCDLKLQNILINNEIRAKIADFGLAKTLKSGNTRKSMIYGYSERNSAYEYLVEDKISTKGDIWSFGVLMYELLKEKIAWENLSGVQAVAKVSMKTPFYSGNESLYNRFEDGIVEKCLNYERSERPSAKELLENIENYCKNNGISI